MLSIPVLAACAWEGQQLEILLSLYTSPHPHRPLGQGAESLPPRPLFAANETVCTLLIHFRPNISVLRTYT